MTINREHYLATSRPKVMTIAGSDSGAGAGIQADLKTFAALGVYGTSVLTAITAQNTLGVHAVEEVSHTLIRAQIDAIMSDIGASAVKTGMLANAQIIDTVAKKLDEHHIDQLVVDPVMVAKGGSLLLRQDAVETLRTKLIPKALIVTPNVPEAEVLTNRRIASVADAKQAAREIVHDLSARIAVVKGGHLEGSALDVYYDGRSFHELVAERIATTSTHGTGCTLSAAIAAYLARRLGPLEAVKRAKQYLTKALLNAYPIGSGHGPLNHLYRMPN